MHNLKKVLYICRVNIKTKHNETIYPVHQTTERRCFWYCLFSINHFINHLFSDDMNTLEIQNLHERAECLLTLIKHMENRIASLKYVDSLMDFTRPSDDKIDTCERGKKRLLESYKRVLTQIIENI